MAKTALVNKAARTEVQGARLHPLPALRPSQAVYKKFGLCRICLREMAHRGELPGVTKVLAAGSNPTTP